MDKKFHITLISRVFILYNLSDLIKHNVLLLCKFNYMMHITIVKFFCVRKVYTGKICFRFFIALYYWGKKKKNSSVTQCFVCVFVNQMVSFILFRHKM